MEAVDVAVVGGGIAGCASAYHLVRGGARVTLLERHQVNGQASGQNAGSLHFHLERRMVEHGPELAERFAQSMPLQLRAEEAWRGLERELGQDLEVEQHGGFVVALTDEEAELLERKVALENRVGLRTELLTGEEVRRRSPHLSSAIRAASFYAGEGHVNPRAVAPAYLRAAAGGDLRVWTETPVVGLGRSGGRWALRLGSGERLLADVVLIAAGAWSGEVAAMANVNLPILPIAVGIMATARTGRVLEHMVQHVGGKLTMKQVRDGNLLIGGGWPTRLPHDARGYLLDASSDQLFESIAGNVHIAREALPLVGELSVLRAWSGMAGVAADQQPLLGAIPRRPGLYALNGTYTLGPVYGELISEQILTGRPQPELAPYAPDRFGHLTFV